MALESLGEGAAVDKLADTVDGAVCLKYIVNGNKHGNIAQLCEHSCHADKILVVFVKGCFASVDYSQAVVAGISCGNIYGEKLSDLHGSVHLVVPAGIRGAVAVREQQAADGISFLDTGAYRQKRLGILLRGISAVGALGKAFVRLHASRA